MADEPVVTFTPSRPGGFDRVPLTEPGGYFNKPPAWFEKESYPIEDGDCIWSPKTGEIWRWNGPETRWEMLADCRMVERER